MDGRTDGRSSDSAAVGQTDRRDVDAMWQVNYHGGLTDWHRAHHTPGVASMQPWAWMPPFHVQHKETRSAEFPARFSRR